MRIERVGTGLCAALLAACATDDVTAAPRAAEGAFTVDASTGWVYVSLRDSAVVTPTPTAGESAAWDVALFATNVTLNGGQAGPGGVSGACVCQNAAANPTNAQWLAMTPTSEQGDYDAITAPPAGAAYTTDAMTPAVTGWTSADSVYVVRLADSSGVAKVRVRSATTTRLTIESAVALNGQTAFGPLRTTTLDLGTGPKSLDLDTGESTTSATAWELRFDGPTVRVNGGISGPGKSAAAKITTTTFAAATPDVTAPNAYRADTYAGVFATSRYYRYNLLGDNRITPTFDVYLIRRGNAVYKFQIVNYYGATGQARVVSFRYKQIAG